jgi:hypothetical protein
LVCRPIVGVIVDAGVVGPTDVHLDQVEHEVMQPLRRPELRERKRVVARAAVQEGSSRRPRLADVQLDEIADQEPSASRQNRKHAS